MIGGGFRQKGMRGSACSSSSESVQRRIYGRKILIIIVGESEFSSSFIERNVVVVVSLGSGDRLTSHVCDGVVEVMQLGIIQTEGFVERNSVAFEISPMSLTVGTTLVSQMFI
jgi:hypothetical protein